MTVAELRRVLRESRVLRDIGDEPTPGELADVLWLAMLNSGPTTDEAAAGPPPAPASPDLPASTAAATDPATLPPVPPAVPPAASPAAKPPDQQEDLHLYLPEQGQAAADPGTSPVLVQAVVGPQLLDPLPLARAMRPLRRRRPATGRTILDEDATADLAAEQRLWWPVLAPASEPDFDLALVVDASDSMALWSALIREFRLLCEQLGAFRDIRSWYLTTGRDDSPLRPTLRGASRSSSARDPLELLDPSARRLILMITDGVHPWWQPSGPLRPILARWAAASPVAIMQPFPQRLWNRSALRPAVAEFHAGGPGLPTARIIRPPRGPANGTSSVPHTRNTTVPLLGLTPTALDRWARLVVGTGPTASLAAAILTGEPAEDHRRPRGGPPDAQADPGQLVRDFRASVSPEAYRLAGYLSAVPLSLPIIRLVQESMLPEAGPAEQAEVFLSGLLRRLSVGTRAGDAENATYGFRAGVREILLSTITRTEALGMVGQVGSYLVHGQRTGRSFPAVLGTVPNEDIRTAAERFPSSFGRVSSMVLERIGGPYAAAARQLKPKPRSGRLPERRTFDGTGLPSRRIYQPMLFVGLGGTGCDVGAELERRLREAICGPDGNDFRRRSGRESMLAYQLPSCVQFVYADLNRAELARLPARVVPAPEHIPAASLTARYLSDLIPPIDSYPDLARNLRLEAERETAAWLPPATRDEPHVSRLDRGAGQFPTVGRAALFGTFTPSSNRARRDTRERAVRDIREAIGRLATSGEDLHALGGSPPSGVDVFVAFSVAGGTGGGIFYDYLHLIADAVQRHSQLRVRIYPLVLMPSAFERGLGGGRAAELNAARALVDLFRLVDQQNCGDAERYLDSGRDQRPIDPEDVAVTYPGNERIDMRSGTVQTGFLFPPPAGASREDMHRSIVSLVMSLVGTEMPENDDWSGKRHESLIDSFVNRAAHRQVAAENGIGNRGVSTALVASLTMPADELAGIVAARLLRTAVGQFAAPIGGVKSSRADMEEFLIKAGAHPVLRRQGIDFAEPRPVNGAHAVTAALNDRRDSMRVGLDSLRVQLGRNVPQLVQGFDPDGAVRDLLGGRDIFRIQRIVSGHPDFADETAWSGVNGLLRGRAAAPAVPAGQRAAPPATPELHDTVFRRTQWNDAEPVAHRAKQDQWYEWRTHVGWAESWDKYSAQWRRPLDRVQRSLNALTSVLTEFADHDAEDFDRRSAELYRRRVGVSYLLPVGNDGGSGRMEQFYARVIARLIRRHAGEGRLRPGSSEADLVQEMVGADGWHETYRISSEQAPELAVAYLRERLRAEVKAFLREPPPGEQPMLPRLADLLAAAAGHGTGPGIMPGDLDEFRDKLAGLVPANFNPQGSGPLKVLITYPADAPSEVIQRHLMRSINLPAGPRITYDYRNTPTESISVVLFRTGMGITEVPEVRDVLRRWAGALARPEPADLLRWRQRTGYDFGYLVTREEDRVEILHRILCALWNGRAATHGPQESPDRVDIEMGGGVAMSLPLTPFGRASSWGSLLRAYELWALDDDDLHRLFCGQLMRELPAGLDGRPGPPSLLYLVLRDLVEGQIELLDDMMSKQAADQRSRAAQMRGFWADTLPAALYQYFAGIDSPVASNLRDLERSVDAGNDG
jgi:hypothetical protein